MENMLIMTDFSEAALRAAEYGCELAENLQVRRIILYHAYQTFVSGTEIPVAGDGQQVYIESMEALATLQGRLRVRVGYDIKIELLTEDIDFPLNINALCIKENIGLIVMGFTGKSGFEKLVIGSMVTRILEHSEYPVLFVPPEMLIGKGITNIVFAADLNDFSAIPESRLIHFLDRFNAGLHVINVAHTDEMYTQDTDKAINALHLLLKKHNPVFHYLNRNDVAASILALAEQVRASLIIMVHRKHNFFYSLFHASTSKELVRKASFPLLSLPGLRSAG